MSAHSVFSNVVSNGKQSLTRNEIFGLVLRLAIITSITVYGVKYLVAVIDPTNKQKKEAKVKAEKLLHKIGVKPSTELTDYELSIAANLVDPASVTTSWTDIAGLDDIIREIRETVILPIKKRNLFEGSRLIQPPKGILLHGPPGCGKTMIAKATAKEAGARFINLEVSSLTDKWYGESQKLAAAVFTLAVKIQPCIIFVDEIDSFLRSRNQHDHEATAMMKALFLSLWDGICTDASCQVIVMGATNRPQDVDVAILRRMPAQFHIGMPHEEQRLKILNLILSKEVVLEGVNLKKIAKETDNFSGSDLFELCRSSAIQRLKGIPERVDNDEFYDALLPMTTEDFMESLKKMKASKAHLGTSYLRSGIGLD